MTSKGLKKIYLLPNIITAFGLSCGLFVIFKMTMMGLGDVDERVLLMTAGIMLLAALADLLDGAVARAMKAESSFGGVFDSLADAITFGVAPSVIVLKTLSVTPGTELSFWLTASAMVFSVCGVLRLVRFSVSAREEHEEVDLAAKKNFTGLPIPAAAAAVISANLFLGSDECPDCTGKFRIIALTTIFFILGYFMVSRWKFPSLKTLQIRVGSFRKVFLTVVASVFLFYGFLNHFALFFLLIAWGYLIISWILSIVRLVSGSRAKTLEDFDPEPEEEEEL